MLPLVGVPPTIAAELKAYREVFCRQEGFEQVSRYVSGLLLSPNKTLEGIHALQVWPEGEAISRRAMHGGSVRGGLAEFLGYRIRMVSSFFIRSSCAVVNIPLKAISSLDQLFRAQREIIIPILRADLPAIGPRRRQRAVGEIIARRRHLLRRLSFRQQVERLQRLPRVIIT